MKLNVAATLLLLATTYDKTMADSNVPRIRHTPIQSRIVGGFPSTAGAFPYFTTVSVDSDFLCGASLIYEDIVLTAAHCQGVFDAGVRIGAQDSSDANDGHFRVVSKEIMHPQYDDFTTANDLMLLKLERPVPVQPVAWERSATAPTVGETLTVMGFGTTSEGGDVSSALQQVDVLAVDDDKCSLQYDGDVELDVMFCAGVTGGGKDSCQGDSGGPIVDENNVQVGIVSWGEGCALATHSGVYTRVGAFGDWIEAKICENSSNPPSYCNNDTGGNNDDTGGNNDDTGGDNDDTGGNNDDVGTIEARIGIIFDQWPGETSWFLIEKAVAGSQENDQVVLVGPTSNFLPEAFEYWEAPVQMRPGRDYEFTIEDTWGDGFMGYFEISTNGENGIDNFLAMGPERDFEYSHTVAFTAPTTAEPTTCTDGTNLIYLDSDSDMYGDCDAVLSGFSYLCDFVDVALECPVTCGICQDLSPVTEDNCEEDQSGLVNMGDLLGERECEWLKISLAESERFALTCVRANVALHCPATCQTCQVLNGRM
jgi:trypsin